MTNDQRLLGGANIQKAMEHGQSTVRGFSHVHSMVMIFPWQNVAVHQRVDVVFFENDSNLQAFGQIYY